MPRTLLLLAALLAACGEQSPTALSLHGLDPTVLIANKAGPEAVIFTWFDQSGQVSTVTVAMGVTQCVKFTATTLADSVRFIAAMGNTTSLDTLPGPLGTPWSKSWSPWFDPATGLPKASTGSYPFGAEYWTLTVATPYGLLMTTVKDPPC